MVYIIHSVYENSIYRKELRIILLICLINIVKAFVVVTTPEFYVLAPKNSNVKLICNFTDDQRSKSQDLTVSWSKDRKITEGIETIWNEKDQIGSTVLRLNNITEKDEGEYTCVITIKGSFDYKKITLQTVNSRTESNVSVIPSYSNVDMWNGPPLKLNCTFKFKEWCEQTKVDWWKLDTTSHIWSKQVTGVNWQANRWGGKGWLNITDPIMGKSEGMFMCIVTCGYNGGFGTRNVKVVPHIGPDIKPQHGVYSAKKGMDIIMACNVNSGIYSEYGWWFKKNLSSGGRYTLKSTSSTIDLIIKKVTSNDNGQYICWVSKDDWWETNSVTLYVSN
ncbi:ig-like domain protein [Albatrosspox virus]|nr:ig-like domain protein [Penguinpox virus 2]QRM16045.1 ig-like domain protein [Albatrosspox virus]